MRQISKFLTIVLLPGFTLLVCPAWAGFVAQPVNVNPFKLILGSLFSAEVSVADQPGQAVTATFERISDYLLKYDVGSRVIQVTPE